MSRVTDGRARMGSKTSSRKRAEFDAILERVMKSLPAPVRALLQEVPVLVEDEPAADLLGEGELTDLCGLHSGIPLSERSVFEAGASAPPSIHLFRGPILRLAAGSRAALERQIRITLLHEIGHHHGLSEDVLRKLGYD